MQRTKPDSFQMSEEAQINLDQLLNRETKFLDFKRILEQCDCSQMELWLKGQQGNTPFHSTLDHHDQIAIAKIKCLFENAERLGIDINAQFNPENAGFPEHVVWNNTPLHNWIANERFVLVTPFLNYAREYGFTVDLNKGDREGKTPFHLAIKMSNVSLEIISQLITPENYNTPDNSGTTPLMTACALRRVDVAKLIIQAEATRLGLGDLDFDHLNEEQKHSLSHFINQQHPDTQKTIGHFAVMRSGTEEDLKQPNSYQQTVLNIAKSIGIDARRDKNATKNAAVNDSGAQVTLSKAEIDFYQTMRAQGALRTLNLAQLGLEQDLKQTEMVFTDLSYRGVEKVENALLASKRNAFLLVTKEMEENAMLYTKIREHIQSYSGISHAEFIMQRTGEMVQFLVSIGLDFSLRQKQGNKTPADYIDVLRKPANRSATTKADQNCLFPLFEQLAELAQKNAYSDEARKSLAYS